jgi:hypothetical protein
MLSILLLVFVLLGYYYVFLPRPPVQGYIRDAETGKPIAGALVKVTGEYFLFHPLFFLVGGDEGGGWGSAYTDKNGYFYIPSRSCTYWKPFHEYGCTYFVPNKGYYYFPKWFTGNCVEVIAPDYRVGRFSKEESNDIILNKKSHLPFLSYEYDFSLNKAKTCDDWIQRYKTLDNQFSTQKYYVYPDIDGTSAIMVRALLMHNFAKILVQCQERPKDVEKPLQLAEEDKEYGTFWSELNRLVVKKDLKAMNACCSIASNYELLWKSRLSATKEMQEAILADMDKSIMDCQQAGNDLEPEFKEAADVAVWLWSEEDSSKKIVTDKRREPVKLLYSDMREKKINGKAFCLPDEKGILDALGTPVLILPTSSLSEAGSNPKIKKALQAYVENGGALFCFAQLQKKDWESLPVQKGEELNCRGTENGSGRYKNAGTVCQEHPILSLKSGSVFSALLDGVFVDVPKNATVLLRTDTHPTMIVYPVGKGWVCAMCSYEDDIKTVNPKYASKNMEQIISNVIGWAKNPNQPIQTNHIKDLDEAKNVSLQMTLTNASEHDAKSVELAVWSPGRENILAQFTVDKEVPAGSKVQIPVKLDLSSYFSTPEALGGIFYVDYRLSSQESWGVRQVQQWSETDDGRLSIIDMR